MCETLSALEPLAAQRLARNGVAASTLRQLETALRAMEEASADNDMPRWIRQDQDFHGLIVHGAENGELAKLGTQLWDRMKRLRSRTAALRTPTDKSNREHAAILAAIRRRQPERVFEVLRDHHLRFAQSISQLLDQHGISEI